MQVKRVQIHITSTEYIVDRVCDREHRIPCAIQNITKVAYTDDTGDNNLRSVDDDDDDSNMTDECSDIVSPAPMAANLTFGSTARGETPDIRREKVIPARSPSLVFHRRRAISLAVEA